MQAEDRVIHFSTELIHQPRKHQRAALQKLYFELSQTSHAAYDNTDFSQPTHARFFTRRQQALSTVIFLADRAVLVEEWADIPLTDFLQKVQEVGRRVLTDLGAEIFAAQTATLRSTFALTHFDDARKFLLERVCGLEDQIAPHFKRPLGTGGLRFNLPETPEHPGNLNVLIESYKRNPREVFVEVKGVYQNQQIDVETVHKMGENIQNCRRFISDNVFSFLNQYDTPKEGIL